MASIHTPESPKSSSRSPLLFAGGFIAFTLASFALTTWAPIALAISIVFLFAGPHNYVEARYFLTRLPARAGKLWPFFAISASGIIGLTAAFAAIPLLQSRWPHSLLWGLGFWNSAAIGWGCLLVWMRSNQSPRRRWGAVWPIGLIVLAVSWLHPYYFTLGLVFAHPVMGLWILDQEIQQRRPTWCQPYRLSITLLPICLAAIWIFSTLQTESTWIPPLMKEQVSRHVGGGYFSESVTQRLVASHAFLELLHYGVWIIAIPIASGRVFSTAFQSVPLMKRKDFLQPLIRTVLLASTAIVIMLWLCFVLDYTTTRQIYFAVAMMHVLAEVPFLLRML